MGVAGEEAAARLERSTRAAGGGRRQARRGGPAAPQPAQRAWMTSPAAIRFTTASSRRRMGGGEAGGAGGAAAAIAAMRTRRRGWRGRAGAWRGAAASPAPRVGARAGLVPARPSAPLRCRRWGWGAGQAGGGRTGAELVRQDKSHSWSCPPRSRRPPHTPAPLPPPAHAGRRYGMAGRLSAVRRGLGGRGPGQAYEVEVVAQHASACAGPRGPGGVLAVPQAGADPPLPPAPCRNRRPPETAAAPRPALWRSELPLLALLLLPTARPAAATQQQQQQQPPTPCAPSPGAAADLPLPAGARAQFLLKRRSRLCVTDPEPVDARGGVEWNTRCTQVRLAARLQGAGSGARLLPVPRAVAAACLPLLTHRLPRRPRQTATLYKEGDGWRAKPLTFKVQAVRAGAADGSGATVAKATLDLGQFCGPEPLGPKQLVLPLQCVPR